MELPVSRDRPIRDRLGYLEAANIKAKTKAEAVVMNHLVALPGGGAFVARSPTYVDVVELQVGGETVRDPRALIPYVAPNSSTAQQARMSIEVSETIETHQHWGIALVSAGVAMAAGGIALGASNEPGSSQFYVGLWSAVGGIVPMMASLFAFATAPPRLQPHRSEMNAKGSFPADFEANLGLCRAGPRRDRIVACEDVETVSAR